MNARKRIAAVVLSGMLTFIVGAQAQIGGNDVQPKAIKAMSAVGSKLRGLDGYSVEMKVKTRAPLGAGRYRDFAGTVRYLVKPPGHLAADIFGDGISRRILYDGINITVQNPARQVYARIEAPGNLRTLLDRINASSGIELPIAEVFTWGTADTPMSSASRARYEGERMVDGRPCQHYSYLEDGVAWEVWIDQAELLCKLVMIDMKDRGLPGYSAELKWNAGMRPADAEFSFEAATGATEVSLAQMAQSDETPKP